MEFDIALQTAVLMAFYIALVGGFAAAFRHVLRKPQAAVGLRGQSRYAQERLHATRRER